ncbi:MAG: glycosyltransferase [Prolixibacteraceae bacterium]|nr:glycosyltransferase [Prolixibacteraceae bacterium]MBN2648941.1 glycosyltransferase [Prolixibacteraceae bacterium]
MENKIVVVLGMHRSGTSAVAKLITKFGFSAGNNLMPADNSNKEGYWEDIDIYNINQQILSFLFSSWDEYEDLRIRKSILMKEILIEEFGEDAIKIINNKLQKDSNIVIKDPRISILLPFWSHIFNSIDANTHYILTVRNPVDVAKSLSKRNNFSENKSFNLWYYYNQCCLVDSIKPLYLIHFENLISSPDKQTINLSSFLKIQISNTIELKKVINKKIIHHKTSDNKQKTVISGYKYIDETYKTLTKNVLIEKTTKPFLNNEFNEEQDIYTSSLFYNEIENDDEHYNTQIKQVSHKEGKQILNFNIEDKKAKDFNFFLCDKQCYVEIYNIRIKTQTCSLEIKEFKSNALYQNGNILLFDSTSPEIKFSLETPEIIEEISIDCFINTTRKTIAGLVVAIQNYYCDINKRQSNPKEQYDTLKDYSNLKTKLSGSLITNSLLIDKNKTLKNQIDAQINEISQKNQQIEQYQHEVIFFTKEIESLTQKTTQFEKALTFEQEKNNKLNNTIETLKAENNAKNDAYIKEKKKADYLYYHKLENDRLIEDLKNEINDLRKSASWIITYPLRFLAGILLSPLYHFKNTTTDLKLGIELLKREGTKRFIYRTFWYMRGKKLNEDIYLHQNKKDLIKPLVPSNTKKTALEAPVYHEPLVSIIIPVYNQWDYTYACIQSIIMNTKDVCYEIIVANDVSTDGTRNIKDFIKNIVVIRNDENLKFVKNNNNAAKYAKGKYLLFLNNDTLVHDNWLKPMLDVYENFDKVGIVGSKLIYPDGRLQEAGGIIWDDASGWNYGRLDDPEKPEYNYVRECDYVSGASLMIDKALWEQLNGFDEHFAPAYYEDTDIAFRARKTGYKVIYQPLSVITHFEGISNGKDVSEGLKKYQIDNADKFFKRWCETLKKEQFPNSENVFIAKDRSCNKKQVLIIDHYVPHFDKDAGSRSTYNYILLLLKMRCKVTFIGDNFFKHEPYTTDLQQKGVEVLYGNYYFRNILQWIKENGRYFTHVFLHRMHIAPKYLDTIKKHTNAKLIYIGHDLQFISSKRKYELTKDESNLSDSEKFELIETKIFNTVDVICPFSTYEAPYIKELAPEKTVETIPVYFYDKLPDIAKGFDQRKDLLFVGGFGHPPNVDAILWFVNEVFPIIQNEIQDIKLHVVGSKPPKEVLALQSDSIIITGFVNDDKLAEYYATCRVTVIPLRFGAGVKGKLLETCYFQLPPIITRIASEGIPDIEKYCIIEDNASDFAFKTINLYNNKVLWDKQQKKCKNLIQNNFTVNSTSNILQKLLT